MSASGFSLKTFLRKTKLVKRKINSNEPEFEHVEYEAASVKAISKVLLIYSNFTLLSLVIKWLHPMAGIIRSYRPNWPDWSKWTTFKSKVVPNILVGLNWNDPFHLISNRNFRNFGLNGKHNGKRPKPLSAGRNHLFSIFTRVVFKQFSHLVWLYFKNMNKNTAKVWDKRWRLIVDHESHSRPMLVVKNKVMFLLNIMLIYDEPRLSSQLPRLRNHLPAPWEWPLYGGSTDLKSTTKSAAQ